MKLYEADVCRRGPSTAVILVAGGRDHPCGVCTAAARAGKLDPMTARLDPAAFAKAVMLESSDIPPDMTLAQWRREKHRTAAVSRGRRRRVLRKLRKRQAFA